jgi:hypothetical protein
MRTQCKTLIAKIKSDANKDLAGHFIPTNSNFTRRISTMAKLMRHGQSLVTEESAVL